MVILSLRYNSWTFPTLHLNSECQSVISPIKLFWKNTKTTFTSLSSVIVACLFVDGGILADGRAALNANMLAKS